MGAGGAELGGEVVDLAFGAFRAGASFRAGVGEGGEAFSGGLLFGVQARRRFGAEVFELLGGGGAGVLEFFGRGGAGTFGVGFGRGVQAGQFVAFAAGVVADAVAVGP
ncbi:hypothetical protein FrEUN1fDRAFT_3616 [Parafrankia sp. EUN1f]|nr:hypothetical protein FrEUN1fDRAFT_3616 [Parafrankia sp. EUN1f]